MKSIEEMRTSYNEYIEKQRVGYEITAAMIGFIVQRLQEDGKVKGKVTISGRIKSFKSAYENTGKKAVDDCFGIRLVGTVEDLTAIEKELNKIFVVASKKDHRKKLQTKYNGVHEMLHMNKKYVKEHGLKDCIFPEIEVQYWSEATKQKCVYGELAYSIYKKKDLVAILNRLKNEPENLFEDMPICYEIQGNSIRRLTDREALYKLYPEIKEMEEAQIRKEKRDLVTVAPDADDDTDR